jgi:hypothetical protein
VFTSQGIAMDSWVLMSGDCALSCEVIGDQAQFEFDHGTSSLHLNASEEGLAKLVQVATEALHKLLAVPGRRSVFFPQCPGGEKQRFASTILTVLSVNSTLPTLVGWSTSVTSSSRL